MELRVLTFNTSILQEFLLKAHTIVDALASIGDIVLASHHIDVILEGFPSKFALVMSVIDSKFGLMDLHEVEIILLAHELCQKIIYSRSSVSQIGSRWFSPTYDIQSTSVNSSPSQPPPPHVEQDFSHFCRFKGSRGSRFKRGSGVNSNAHI